MAASAATPSALGSTTMDLDTGLLVAILTILVLSMLFRGRTSEPSRLQAVDRKLNLILANLGIDPYEGLDQQIVELVRSGQKIEAIKLYREQTGAGLKESKDYVEGL
jgi:ribosomal protein L7/L12